MNEILKEIAPSTITAIIVGILAVIHEYQMRRQIEQLTEHDEKLIALAMTDHQAALAQLEELRQRQELIMQRFNKKENE